MVPSLQEVGRLVLSRRLLTAALFALPITLALLYLMTRLILPGPKDPLVNRMLQNIELYRTRTPEQAIAIPEPPPPPVRPRLSRLDRPATSDDVLPESLDPEPAKATIDWWTVAKDFAATENPDDLERWLIENGHAPYSGIMQGELPITNSVTASLPPNQENVTGYMNTYGDKEIKVSENCVAQSLVSARLDISDFAKQLPMRIMCKDPAKKKYSFERD